MSPLAAGTNALSSSVVVSGGQQQSPAGAGGVPLCRCRVLYIGSAVPTITKDGLQGIQQPLRERYPATSSFSGEQSPDAKGIDAWLSVWANGLLLEYVDGQKCVETAFFPITTLHYCAAVRYVNMTGFAVEGGGERFIPLDTPFAHIPDSPHPPIFAAIFRRTSGVKVLECHAFVCTNDRAANALVRCCFHSYADVIYSKMDPGMLGGGMKALKLGGTADQTTSSRSVTPTSELNMSFSEQETGTANGTLHGNPLLEDEQLWQDRAIGAKTWQHRQQNGEYDEASLTSSLQHKIGTSKDGKQQQQQRTPVGPNIGKHHATLGRSTVGGEIEREDGILMPYHPPDPDVHRAAFRRPMPPIAAGFYGPPPPPPPFALHGAGGRERGQMPRSPPQWPPPPPRFMGGPIPPFGVPFGPGVPPPPPPFGFPPSKGKGKKQKVKGKPMAFPSQQHFWPPMMIPPQFGGFGIGPGGRGGFMGHPPPHYGRFMAAPMYEGPPARWVPGMGWIPNPMMYPPPNGPFPFRSKSPPPPSSGPIITDYYETFPRRPPAGASGGMTYEEPIYMPGATGGGQVPTASYRPGNFSPEHYEQYYETYRKGGTTTMRRAMGGESSNQRAQQNGGLDSKGSPPAGEQHWTSYGTLGKSGTLKNAPTGAGGEKMGASKTNGHNTPGSSRPPGVIKSRPDTPPADYEDVCDNAATVVVKPQTSGGNSRQVTAHL